MEREVKRSSLMRAIEAKEGKPVDQAIRDAYDAAGNLSGTAYLLGIDKVTLVNWMRRFGLELRKSVRKVR